VPRDWHDWDVSNPPTRTNTADGKRLIAESPKDGDPYSFDLADNKLLDREPVTRIENAEEPFAVDKGVHFGPGAGGGTAWNTSDYDPLTNRIFTPKRNPGTRGRLREQMINDFLDHGLLWIVSQPHAPTLDLLGS
jgi:hypothetical protein